MNSNTIRSVFSAADARRITGVTQRQLDYWDQQGLVVASLCSKRGKGVERQYSYTDLVKLRVVSELRRAGLSLQRIRKAIAKLRQKDPQSDPLTQECLITDGKRVHRLTKDPAFLEDLLGGGQLAFSVVFVGKVEAQVRRLIPRQKEARRASG